MTALRQSFRRGDWLELAACCLIGLPIPDIQHETPRGIGKGRLLTPSGTLSLLQRRHPESPKRTLSCMRRRATRGYRSVGVHRQTLPAFPFSPSSGHLCIGAAVRDDRLVTGKICDVRCASPSRVGLPSADGCRWHGRT